MVVEAGGSVAETVTVGAEAARVEDLPRRSLQSARDTWRYTLGEKQGVTGWSRV